MYGWKFCYDVKMLCLLCNWKKNLVTETNLCQHDEPQKEGCYCHCQNEKLSAVFTAEDGRIHVHHSCHQALHAHKLIRRETTSIRYAQKCMCAVFYGLTQIYSKNNYNLSKFSNDSDSLNTVSLVCAHV